MVRRWFIILCFTLGCHNLFAQQNSTKHFMDRDTLVFEDSESIWPYTFLNDEGKPDGYCIDLLDMLMEELNIPYVVHLKNHQEVLRDLKEGKADLILGLADVYEEKYGHYSQSTITLLTQSMVTPKSRPVTLKSFRNLKTQQVIVKDSGLVHHLMIDYGWGDNAIVRKDMATAIREVNDKQEGQIVWNTMTLKWLINHYKLDGLVLTPVNMPHGETKFLSNNQELLDLIDHTYTELSVAGKLEPLEQKWLHPDPPQLEVHQWVWYMAAIAGVLLLVATVLMIIELRNNYKQTKNYHKLANKLADAARMNKMRFWTYHVSEHKFTWHDVNGTAIDNHTEQEFESRYNKHDAEKLQEALEKLITRHVDAKGHLEKEETLELKAKDKEAGDNELHDFVVHLSVLNTDAHNKPVTIVGAKKDVTKEHQLQLENTERSLCYLSLFYNNESGILLFDRHGCLQNANTRAGELLGCDMDDMVKRHVFMNHFFHTIYTYPGEADGKSGSIKVQNWTVKYHMKAIYDNYHQLLGLFAFCV